MSNGQTPADEVDGGRKVYSVKLQAKPQASQGCSFCWFVMALYPTLNGMTERDSATYTAHLRKVHGLREEIQA